MTAFFKFLESRVLNHKVDYYYGYCETEHSESHRTSDLVLFSFLMTMMFFVVFHIYL